MSFLAHLLGATLVSRKGHVETDQALAKKSVIGLYFSASWCNPCREFTPILATVYRNMSLSTYKDLPMRHEMEVVMVSMDRDTQSFQDYVSQTPWLAIPFERRDLVKDLWKRYDVKTIPTLDLRAIWRHIGCHPSDN